MEIKKERKKPELYWLEGLCTLTASDPARIPEKQQDVRHQ
jgi:hypothetical protein